MGEKQMEEMRNKRERERWSPKMGGGYPPVANGTSPKTISSGRPLSPIEREQAEGGGCRGEETWLSHVYRGFRTLGVSVKRVPPAHSHHKHGRTKRESDA